MDAEQKANIKALFERRIQAIVDGEHSNGRGYRQRIRRDL
jgi:hypothetical protein